MKRLGSLAIESRCAFADSQAFSLTSSGSARRGTSMHVAHAAGKTLVDVAAQVVGQDDGPVVLVHFLQEVDGFNVGVAFVRVVDF
jgi:hypothetical protein